ncbi:G1 family glutamic endopeptidase [Clostridium sp. Mt-5]|uniref:G1 family glutamic endopeptidase n=1 Tax=Clostridium moutaii TaxID=3240932 RepID=A0ABV4BVK0_9CLOT
MAKGQAKDTSNGSYVLSGYFPRRNLINSIRNYHPQSTETTINLPANTEKSSNWAGYIDTPTSQNNSYTSISGSWIVPTISSAQQDTSAAQWIGLGGVNSKDLLQMGTIEEIKNGQPTAEVFWEELPNVAQNIMSIPIGSTISSSISKTSDSTWNLVFTATTPQGQTETKTISTTLDSSYAEEIGTSGEWISEDPSNQYSQLFPLANAGTVKYQSATVNGTLLNSSSNTVHPVAMISSNGNVSIYPSTIETDGESFTTTTNISSIAKHRFNNFPKYTLKNPNSKIHSRKSMSITVIFH